MLRNESLKRDVLKKQTTKGHIRKGTSSQKANQTDNTYIYMLDTKLEFTDISLQHMGIVQIDQNNLEIILKKQNTDTTEVSNRFQSETIYNLEIVRHPYIQHCKR